METGWNRKAGLCRPRQATHYPKPGDPRKHRHNPEVGIGPARKLSGVPYSIRSTTTLTDVLCQAILDVRGSLVAADGKCTVVAASLGAGMPNGQLVGGAD
jgi:hypothetical protein